MVYLIKSLLLVVQQIKKELIHELFDLMYIFLTSSALQRHYQVLLVVIFQPHEGHRQS